MISTIIEIIVGALSGAAAGAVAGFAFSFNEVLGAYTGWRTFWPACGPHLFIPLWLGAVIGLVARVERDTASGFLTTLLCGIAAGFAAPWLFFMVFGKTLHISFGFISIVYAEQIALAVVGGISALFWYFSVNKILR